MGTDVREGMVVYSAEGAKLGHVVSCDAATFVIEKGRLFKRDLVARYEDVQEVTADEVRLRRNKQELDPAGRGVSLEGTMGRGPFGLGG